MENIESIISKPLNDITLEEGIESMPLNEIMETLKMDNFYKLKAILKVKNDIIWNLILLRKKIPESHLKEMKEKEKKNNSQENKNYNSKEVKEINYFSRNYYSSNYINNGNNIVNNNYSYSNYSKAFSNNNYSNNNYSKSSSKHNIEEMAEMDIKNSIEGIKYFVKRNNFNLFQLLSENAIENNKEYITKDNLLACLQKLNIDIDDDKLTRLLIKYDLFKNYNSVPINEFSKLITIY